MPTVKKQKKQVTKVDTNKNVSKKGAVKKKIVQSAYNLSVQVYNTAGKKIGTQKLTNAAFGLKNNPQLISQALRVYQTNMSTHLANTKIRGEVRGGGAKPWRQKGTGNARAGSRRSPLWVGGGITFGPRFRNVKLTLPQKIKHKALLIALSEKSKAGNIHIISDIEKIKPKTKIIAGLLRVLGLKGKTLLVVSGKNQNVKLATRNIKNLDVDSVSNLNSYEVLKTANVLFSKESILEVK